MLHYTSIVFHIVYVSCPVRVQTYIIDPLEVSPHQNSTLYFLPILYSTTPLPFVKTDFFIVPVSVSYSIYYAISLMFIEITIGSITRPYGDMSIV